MNQTLTNLSIGAFAGGLSGYLIQSYNRPNTWRTFAFLWAAPILLFVPIYVAYNEEKMYIEEFLKHALLGVILSLVLVLLTLFLININIILALLVNFILSLYAIKIYFDYF
jgi:hypothetical protein